MSAPSRRRAWGVGLMLAAMAVLPGIDVLAKILGNEGMPVLQVVWARVTLGAAITLPFAYRIGGRAALIPDRPVYHTLRATFLVLATFCFFLSLKWLPIADALAIFFVQPLILTVLSALFLKERVDARRWIAVAIGFCGTLIIIRPGLAEINPGSWFALAAGAALAIYFMMTRAISGQAHAMVTTFQTNLLGGLILSAGIWWVWVPPTSLQWGYLGLMAFIAVFGHLMIVKAYDYAEASLLAPLAYTEIVTSVLLGWLFFQDFPDRFTFLGVAVLIGCAIYISVQAQRGGESAAKG
jgi:drug/metabolite transporter (DMT)-like permease